MYPCISGSGIAPATADLVGMLSHLAELVLMPLAAYLADKDTILRSSAMCNAILYYIMRYAMLCYAMLYYAMLCYASYDRAVVGLAQACSSVLRLVWFT